MKSFTDGDFVKDCLMAVVEVICPGKKKLFSNVSLSATTVTRRIEEMSEDVKTRQQDCLKICNTFQLLLTRALIQRTQLSLRYSFVESAQILVFLKISLS